MKLLFSKKWQKLEYNPAQKIQKINRVPDCNTDFTVVMKMEQKRSIEHEEHFIGPHPKIGFVVILDVEIGLFYELFSMQTEVENTIPVVFLR